MATTTWSALSSSGLLAHADTDNPASVALQHLHGRVPPETGPAHLSRVNQRVRKGGWVGGTVRGNVQRTQRPFAVDQCGGQRDGFDRIEGPGLDPQVAPVFDIVVHSGRPGFDRGAACSGHQGLERRDTTAVVRRRWHDESGAEGPGTGNDKISLPDQTWLGRSMQ